AGRAAAPRADRRGRAGCWRPAPPSRARSRRSRSDRRRPATPGGASSPAWPRWTRSVRSRPSPAARRRAPAVRSRSRARSGLGEQRAAGARLLAAVLVVGARRVAAPGDRADEVLDEEDRVAQQQADLAVLLADPLDQRLELGARLEELR